MNRRRKKIQRWHAKIHHEAEEDEGLSPEQIQDRAEAQMLMVLAPILEAFRRGEITHPEAARRIAHESIKSLQELIKEDEEDIDALLHFGRPETRNPELLERQRISIEKQRREDPVIQKLQAHIDELKQEITKAEQRIQGTYSLPP